MIAVQFKTKKDSYHAPMSGVVTALGNIQLKIDAAAGAATALEMRLRIVAEYELVHPPIWIYITRMQQRFLK